MKIFIQSYYFIRSLLLRGVINSFNLLRAEAVYEKKYGIETSTVKISRHKQFFHYQGAPYLVLFRILSELNPLTQSHLFVDIGCGKGRALLLAEQAGFNHLVGIELDAELAENAKENFRNFSHKRPDSRVEILSKNALEMEYENRPSVYFMFNPFSEEILEKVLERIGKQNQSPDNYFAYVNPLYQAPFHERRMRLLKVIKTRWYTEAVIYHSSPDATSSFRLK